MVERSRAGAGMAHPLQSAPRAEVATVVVVATVAPHVADTATSLSRSFSQPWHNLSCMRVCVGSARLPLPVMQVVSLAVGTVIPVDRAASPSIGCGEYIAFRRHRHSS